MKVVRACPQVCGKSESGAIHFKRLKSESCKGLSTGVQKSESGAIYFKRLKSESWKGLSTGVPKK